MNLEGFSFKRIKHDCSLLPFDCGDTDLNDFFINDCKKYLHDLLAVTYVLEKDGKTVAFFSILNDKISIDDADSNSQWWKRIGKKFAAEKRNGSYPAVKVGRLGVHTDFRGQDIGTSILDYVKFSFIDHNKTGCRFITVDAYKTALGFYEKNNFKYLTSEKSEESSSTRLMYYDLKPLTLSES
ncbi:MAG: GNAT family N-acetyltransferase [Bacteroidia bacterium]